MIFLHMGASLSAVALVERLTGASPPADITLESMSKSEMQTPFTMLDGGGSYFVQ